MAAILDDIISGPPFWFRLVAFLNNRGSILWAVAGCRPSWMTSLPVRHLGWRHFRPAILENLFPVTWPEIQDGGPEMTSSKMADRKWRHPRWPPSTLVHPQSHRMCPLLFKNATKWNQDGGSEMMSSKMAAIHPHPRPSTKWVIIGNYCKLLQNACILHC